MSSKAIAQNFTLEKNKTDRHAGFYIQWPKYDGETPLILNRHDILAKLAQHGAVLFRGFAFNIETFSQLVDLLTPKTAIDPARDFFAKNVQLVNSGLEEVGLHCENATTPLIPEIVWFYCEQAAKSGSQTTLCDGFRVWKTLSHEAKDLLLSNRVKFSRNVKKDLWVKYVKHHFKHLASEQNIDQKMLDEVFGNITGADVRLNEDGSLFLSHSAFTAHPTFFSDSIAFANSILGPSYNYEPPKISFENGEPLPNWLLKECHARTSFLTTDVDWISGDVIMIDNTRVMHGRRQITDPNRRIFTALGFLANADKVTAPHHFKIEEVGL